MGHHRKHTRAHAISLLAVSCGLVGTASAQTTTYQYTGRPKPQFKNEITVTATGVETETADIPAPITVIDRHEIESALTESVADLLRRVPGVTIMRTGDEGKVTSVFMRGAESDQTLVLFDGVRLNSAYFGGYDLSLLTTAGLDRIEVARGPYSALWGADAIGGVINLIPMRSQQGFNASVFGEVGSDGWRRYEGELVFGSEHFGVYASGLYRESDGEQPNSDFKTEQGLIDLGWSWADGSRIAVVYQLLDSETGIPFVVPGEPTPERRQWADQKLLAVPMRLAITNNWKLELMASEVTRQFRFSDPDDPFSLTESASDADTTQARLASHHSVSKHTLSWGSEWREDEVSDVSVFGTTLDREKLEVTSAFAQDVWQASQELQIIAGLRWDDTDEWGSETSPRVHLGWQLSKTYQLRAGYGEAFRQPSLGELYFPLSGNPELIPETSRSYELDLVGRSKRGTNRWQLNLFVTDLEDLIEFDFISYSNRNIASASIRGVEFVMEKALSRDYFQQFQLSWMNTEDDQGQELLRRPEWSASFTLTGSMSERLRGDLSLLYLGSRWDVDPVSFERRKAGDALTTNLALAWRLRRDFELTIRAINLGNTSYQEVLGYPAAGRRLMGGLRVSF
jgi:TonB-dependent vitamin B12 receptor